MMRLSILLMLFFFLGCEKENSFICLGDFGGCVEDSNGPFATISDCELHCGKPASNLAVVTVFLYENCPIAQYMCGPLREASRYFCDTLNQNILFRGFSPNSLSTEESLIQFVNKYDIPFNVSVDYNHINNQHGSYTQYYQPVVTPEVFVEMNNELVYRGMIDNSYQELGQWSLPTEHYLTNILHQIVDGESIKFLETTAVGCVINY